MFATILFFTCANIPDALASSIQPLIPHYRCAEVLALSGPSIVGIPTRIVPPVPGGEQYKVSVEFKDVKGFGEYKMFPQMGDFLSVDKYQVEEWIAKGSIILTFQGGSWLNLEDPKSRFFDRALNPIPSANALLACMKQTRRQNPMIERVRVFWRSVSKEEAARINIEREARVGVPCDQDLERWAIRFLNHKDLEIRHSAISALRWFESPSNERRLRKLLNDPLQNMDGNREPIFPIRERAREILEAWGKFEEKVRSQS